MKVVLVIGLILLIAVGGFFLTKDVPVQQESNLQEEVEDIPLVTEIATGLEIPWDIAFLPDDSMLVTERTGHIIHIDTEGVKRELAYEHDTQRGEGGLLGIVLHPDFENNKYVYLYMTTQVSGSATENRVIRYKYEDSELVEDKTIISGIPGAIYHDGGRMEFGPDGFLYVTTGDATSPESAQNLSSLAGKVLRVNDDGSIPSDNPFKAAVYSYGHRNPQGLAWDASGRLWETEHGPTGELGICCRDEVNLIKKGGNYGWPKITDTQTRNGMETPILSSGLGVWAPASAAVIGDRLFFGGLRGEALYEANIADGNPTDLTEHFKDEWGRIRTVRVGPEGMLYITTSNRDGRGTAGTGDDKIIRINPKKL